MSEKSIGDGARRAASAGSASPSAVTPMTYEQAGVDYGVIDPLKIAAQRAAAATAAQLQRHGVQEVGGSRGESAYVVDLGGFCLASIVECLGSKALVADEMARLTGVSRYDDIAQDTIAMAVNDLITVGATPLVVQAYWAAGGSEWFHDPDRAQALVRGWQRACETCGVAWGGGETPALAGIVEAGRIDLAASCVGIVQPKSRLTLGERLGPGDAIVLLAASGIHANGLSLARRIAERLPEGYLTRLPGVGVRPGPTYGDALLTPTPLYSPVTEALHAAGVRVHYAVNVTGHGWRKLLRHPKALTYRIHHVPPVPPVLDFLRRQAGHDEREAYATFNMGAGFALYVHGDDAARAVEAAHTVGHEAWVAGWVEDGAKRLVIEPLDLAYGEDDLHVR